MLVVCARWQVSPSGAPVIMWGPDCADPEGFPHMLGDYPRAAVARPAKPEDPHLIDWTKGPHNVSFVNGATASASLSLSLLRLHSCRTCRCERIAALVLWLALWSRGWG